MLFSTKEVKSSIPSKEFMAMIADENFEFDEFMAMIADENFESESDTKEQPFEKIFFNTDYNIKTSLEEPPTDLELKPLLDNLEYVFLETPFFLLMIISSQLSEENKNKLISVLKRHKQAFAWKMLALLFCKAGVLQAADHVVALTLGFAITIPETANKSAIKGEIRAFSQHENETLTDAWLRMKEMLRKFHGHNLSKGNIIKIFYHGLNKTTQDVLNAAASAKNMLVEVGKFTFPADFVILKMEEDNKVSLILGRPFLHTTYVDCVQRSWSSNDEIELNTAYPLPLDTTYPVLCPIQRIHPNRLIWQRMTKVIKGEFEKIKDIKVEDDLLALRCHTWKFSMGNMTGMIWDFDPSDLAFTEWLGSKFFNYKTMDHYTMKALWIYWIRGDDEVELTDEEFSDNEDEIAEIRTYLQRILWGLKPMMIQRRLEKMNGIRSVPWVDEYTTWDLTLVFGTRPKPVIHTCKPFNYKTGCSEWPTCSWMNDGYCNGGNLPGTFIIENQLHYQDYEWYEALEDSELKDEALRNKAIMEGFIKDDDDESSYEQIRRWDIYTNYDDTYKTNHDDNERDELCEVHEPPVCTIQRFEMIKYSFGQGEEYVAIKEDEYDDLARTSNNACRTYQEIFRMMDEGWMVTRAE
ncbi:hypothetical protein Tco_0591344 [Tanacetum coccineum]